MALYCKSCRQAIPFNEAQCSFCKNGFVNELVCGDCGHSVPRGQSSCQTPGCVIIDAEYSVKLGVGSEMTVAPLSPPLDLLLPPIGPMGFPLPAPIQVAPVYKSGKFGVTSYVTHEGRDASILTTMSQAVTLLHALAGEMNNFQGVMPSTRRVIKASRDLATMLQEEIEERRGPQG